MMFVQILIDKGESERGLRWIMNIKTTTTIDPLHCTGTGTPAASGNGDAGTLRVRALVE